MPNTNLENMLNEAGNSYNNASMLASQRRLPEAIEQYKDALKRLHELEVIYQYNDKAPENLINTLNQNLYHGYADIGNCYLDLSKPNFNEASRAFLNALAYGQIQSTVGNLLYCIEQINAFVSSAVIIYKENELDGNFVNLHNQGYNLLKENLIPQAAEILQRASKINPNFAPTYHLLGLVYEKLKQDELAVKSWLKVLELKHDYNFETRIKIQLS
ncbi:MAG: hypothetical protein GF353_29175 [Candidatus Lokiarchaeota archaeon]|nr:hypothetical protein [Candidatus Lokiarchaeota archaeon]